MKIAILQIVLGAYHVYWDQFWETSEKYFCKGHSKHYYVFTDNKEFCQKKNVTFIEQDYLGWPFSSLYRYHIFSRITYKLKEFDYVVFFNANIKFLQKINIQEFFGDKDKKIIAGIHPHYYLKSSFPIEKRIKSKCFIKDPKIYVQGCINGGETEEFLNLVKKMKSLINKDLANGIMPIWHDESYWNFIINDYHKKEFYKLHLLNPNYLCPSKYKNKSSKIIQLNKLKDFNFQDKKMQLSILTLVKFILIKIKKKLI